MAEVVEASASIEGETGLAQEMDIETGSLGVDGESNGAEVEENGGGGAKRERDEEEKGDGDDEGVSKKPRAETSVEEERLEELGEEDSKKVSVSVGPKVFGSSVDMFDYFYTLLHNWSPNLNINKYEQIVLLDLLKKGHAEPEKKIGVGIQAFQVRYHPMWKSRCFFLVRTDGTSDDFSFRKCVDNILPLPENMKANLAANGKAGGPKKGGGGYGDRGSHGGRGRGGRGRGRRGRK